MEYTLQNVDTEKHFLTRTSIVNNNNNNNNK